MFGFLINAFACALNIAMYANDPNPWSIFAAVFCGALAIFCLVLEMS